MEAQVYFVYVRHDLFTTRSVFLFGLFLRTQAIRVSSYKMYRKKRKKEPVKLRLIEIGTEMETWPLLHVICHRMRYAQVDHCSPSIYIELDRTIEDQHSTISF